MNPRLESAPPPATGRNDARRTLATCVLLLLVAAAFRFPGLGEPAVRVQDESYDVADAVNYLHGVPPVTPLHPPTSRLLHAAGIALFGLTPWAWRLPSAVAGTLLAPVFFLLARRALRSNRAALIASCLFLCDGLYLMFSRLATTNIFAVLFQTATAALLLRALPCPRLPRGTMLLCGLFLGLALSTRWSTLPLVVFFGLVVLVTRRGRAFERGELLLLFVSLVAVPAAVYVISYIPWMAQGHTLREMVALQPLMWRGHIYGDGTEPYVSRWYTWPWLYRPPLYFYEEDPRQGVLRIILAVGNPVIWWLSVPAAAAALVLGAVRRDARALYAAVGFAFAYLPWMANPRQVVYLHYFFETVPFACLALGFLLDRGLEVPRLRWLCRAYLLVAVLVFLHFVPVLTARPVSRALFYHRLFANVYPWRWLPTWYVAQAR